MNRSRDFKTSGERLPNVYGGKHIKIQHYTE